MICRSLYLVFEDGRVLLIFRTYFHLPPIEENGISPTARSEMGKPMHEGPNGFTAVVTHAVELTGFPSQWRGPVLAVYCLDENNNVLVQPRWLDPGGHGEHHGPIFRTQDLRGGLNAHNVDTLAWFPANQINFLTWSELALQNAP